MKSYSDSMARRLLRIVVMVFLAVALFGCNDPIVKRMESEHQKLGRVCQQQIRQAQLDSGAQSVSTFPSSSQTGVMYPTP